MSPPVPGLRVTSVSTICCRTYDEFASSTSDGSLRFRSPGMATTRVPPCLGAPPSWLGASLVVAEAGAEAGAEGAAWGGAGGGGGAGAKAGAWLGGVVDGAVVGAGGGVVPPHAETMIAPAATSAPMRTRDIRAPPPAGVRDREIAGGRPGAALPPFAAA